MTRRRHRKAASPTSGQLRIIAGQWRGRKLSFPSVSGLRPTGDRVRETLFNWLQADVAGSRCLDLFAGSGALGFEALSRGASHCTFIDNQAAACDHLKTNLSLLQCQDADVYQMDALTWLQQVPPTGSQPYDLIFCDPPFAQDLWLPALAALECHPVLAPEALMYVESPLTTPLKVDTEHWQLRRSKESGQVRFCLFQALA